MTKFYTKSYTGFRLLREITLVLAVICGSLAGVKALDASVYAGKSRLAAGTWVKVAVTSGGMHFIPEGTLRSWGFSDPSKVKIYGYGGRRLPNLLGNSYRARYLRKWLPVTAFIFMPKARNGGNQPQRGVMHLSAILSHVKAITSSATVTPVNA